MFQNETEDSEPIDGFAVDAFRNCTGCGVNYVITEQHLEILESEGILAHAKFGKRIRYYRYNETPKARAVQKFMDAFQEKLPE